MSAMALRSLPVKDNLPAQHRILPTLRRTIFHVSPSLQKLLMRHHPSQLASNGAVDILDDSKIRGKEYVEVALLDLTVTH